MPILAVKVDATAVDVRVMDDRILVVLADGRELAAPLAWFPRLADATAAQRKNWRLIGRGHGIHWPDVMLSLQVEPELGTVAEITAEAQRGVGGDRTAAIEDISDAS